MSDDPLHYLEQWYRRQCDGDWEHSYGVELGTLDNPGWKLRIDLVGTDCEGRQVPRTKADRSDDDWCHVWSDGVRFEAAAGSANLSEMLSAFRSFSAER